MVSTPATVDPLNIVMVASEAVPYAKTGGLGDVLGILPSELIKLGHRVTVVLPGYRSVLAATQSRRTVADFRVPVADRSVDVALEEQLVRVSDDRSPLRILVVRCDPYFDRPGLYQDEKGDYPDNLERFTVLCRAAFHGLTYLADVCGEPAHLLHLHDWHAALCAVYLKAGVSAGSAVRPVKTLLTVHNIGYQGLFPGEQFVVTGLHPTVFSPNALEYYGSVNCLKGGIVFSDAVSTVSPTHAQEIMTREFGCGLEGVLASRGDRVQGITNGIDMDVWNPETDQYVPAHYTEADLSGKRICKEAIQRELGLPVRDVPLLAAIGRLTPQKGFDLLLDIIPELALLDVQVAVLGTGDRALEQRFLDMRAAYSDRVAVQSGFHEGLAHRIEAGADMLVMPSRYEPCGLTQLYSLRYGTIPIVCKTGGLVDTVVPFKPSTVRAKRATGFHVDEASSEALLTVVLLAVMVWKDRDAWQSMMRTGMKTEMSWAHAAVRYEQLYRSIIAV